MSTQSTQYLTDQWDDYYAQLRETAQEMYGERAVEGNYFHVSIEPNGQSRTHLGEKQTGAKLVIASVMGLLGTSNAVHVRLITSEMKPGNIYTDQSVVLAIMGPGQSHDAWTHHFFEHVIDEKNNPGNHPAIRALMDVCECGGTVTVRLGMSEEF